MAKKSLHKQVKSALRQLPERPFEEDMWLDMQGRLQEDKERKRLPIWLMTGLLSVLVLSAFVLLFSEGLFSERIENSTDTKVVLRAENRENSMIINSESNQTKIQRESIEKVSEKTITKLVEPSKNINAAVLQDSGNEDLISSQVADNELIEFNLLSFEQERKDSLPQEDNKHFVSSELGIAKIMTLSFKVIESKESIAEKVPEVLLISDALKARKTPEIQVGFFTGKTYSYLGFPALNLMPEESKSSKIHFGLSTLFKLNEYFKIGFNLHYKNENYSSLSNWDNVPTTATHFVSKIESTPKLLGLGLNFSYYPLRTKGISPYLGLGIQQDLKLQETRVYSFSPSVYSPGLLGYTETKNVKGEIRRTRTTLMKVGTEVKLSSRIQMFGECLRHFPLEKETNSYRYKWSWRAGILFNLKQQ